MTLFCYLFLKVEPKGTKKPSLIDKTIAKLKGYYKNLILSTLANKWKVIIGIFLIFFASLYGFTKIPFLFFPDSDRNIVTIDINLAFRNKNRNDHSCREADGTIHDRFIKG